MGYIGSQNLIPSKKIKSLHFELELNLNVITKDAVDGSTWSGTLNEISLQGSWAHGTSDGQQI